MGQKIPCKNFEILSVMADVNCSVCNYKNGNRFECLVCPTYNLCRKCHEDQRCTRKHRAFHPMQSVLSNKNLFRWVNSIIPPEDDIRLCCPYCGSWVLNPAGLQRHCHLKHGGDLSRVKCPVCVTFGAPERNLLRRDLKDHLQEYHNERGERFSCDTCYDLPILGNRYMCLACNDYGQCEVCYKAKRCDKNHLPYHPMQLVLPIAKYLAQKTLPVKIYRCPFCGENKLSGSGLAEHCHELHIDCETHRVICPICSVSRLPFEEYSLLKNSFLDHLKNYHGLLPKDNQPESRAECPICLLELLVVTVKKYCQCSHNGFHDQCIRNWLATNPTCPVCRAKRA